jgi:hypothetical protein
VAATLSSNSPIFLVHAILHDNWKYKLYSSRIATIGAGGTVNVTVTVTADTT